MSDCPPDVHASSQASNRLEIIEIHTNALIVRTRMRAILVGVGVGIAAVIGVGICAGLIAGFGGSPTIAWSFVIICIIAALAVSWFRHGRWSKDIDAAIGALSGPTYTVAALAVEKLRYRPVSHGLSILRRQLVSRGSLGVTIRISPESKPEDISPLQVPVEPFSLDESNERFLQLALTGSQAVGQAAAKNLESDENFRNLRRVIPLAVLSALLLWIVARPAYTLILTGNWDNKDFLVGAIIALAAFHTYWTLYAERTGMLALTGGLLYRRRWPRVGSHLFVRERSVLIIYREIAAQWRWIVCDESYPSGIDMTGSASEAEMLLRAWLSPLPPPEMERLSDFRS